LVLVRQDICEISKLCTNKHGGSGVMVDPSAHPLHINGLKHNIYALSGCGNHSMWVWGLNQCTSTSFAASLTQDICEISNYATTSIVVVM
jgi:hypothetical protein